MKSSGFILLDKPSGISSRAAGGRVARMFGAKTFGHIGTLDPMASGLLVIALGQATKMIPYQELVSGNQELVAPAACRGGPVKEYEFSIKWGIKTDTDDITGKVIAENQSLVPSPQSLEKACESLIGEIWQTPPAYSAVHIEGRRAYELARSGKAVKVPPRKITIYELKKLSDCRAQTPSGVRTDGNSCNIPTTNICALRSDNFIVRCSPGTYVRSIVQDIAKLCREIATCDMIRRTKTNGFDIKNAVRLDFLENMYNNEPRSIEKYLMPLDFGLGDIPVCNLDETDATRFSNGNFIGISFKESGISGLVRIYSDNDFIGIGILEDNLLKPKRIINN
jgi:tRNA pseudouridine55 synthase